MKSSEYQKQACLEFDRRARTELEPNIHKASFIERRLFYLNKTSLRPERSHTLLFSFDVVEGSVLSLSKGQVQANTLLKIKLCYKGMQCD